MRSTENLAVALMLASLAGCSSSHMQPRGDGVTTMLVVNNTDRPIQVSYAQAAANTKATAIQVEQRLYPEDSVRFAGKTGDRLTVTAGEEPPLVVQYGRRSHVLNVTGAGPEVEFDLHRGFSESEARGG